MPLSLISQDLSVGCCEGSKGFELAYVGGSTISPRVRGFAFLSLGLGGLESLPLFSWPLSSSTFLLARLNLLYSSRATSLLISSTKSAYVLGVCFVRNSSVSCQKLEIESGSSVMYHARVALESFTASMISLVNGGSISLNLSLLVDSDRGVSKSRGVPRHLGVLELRSSCALSHGLLVMRPSRPLGRGSLPEPLSLPSGLKLGDGNHPYQLLLKIQ
ncbi:hypothetical protein PanWU01x14_201300 [Parasponia andersonii]|uniref:Uncharacterized protein n=1 Tax=Parasponia andersonii TaxID=3476 RepID=A0A2P5BXQ0_PARAD|nr:hypothetical protein PanWU01x14_201300 [Parasponia andersonii]